MRLQGVDAVVLAPAPAQALAHGLKEQEMMLAEFVLLRARSPTPGCDAPELLGRIFGRVREP